MTFDSNRDGSTEVFTLAIENLAVRQITDFTEPDLANRFPDWSPDGHWIAIEKGKGEDWGFYLVP